MSRSGYSDDCDGWALIRWRGAVNSAIRGARGQRLLGELLGALDAMPVRELVAGDFQAEGCFCALGVVGSLRGMDVSKLDPEDRAGVAQAFNVAEALAAEVMYVNDEDHGYWDRWGPAPKSMEELQAADRRDRERRWQRVRTWVAEHLRANVPDPAPSLEGVRNA